MAKKNTDIRFENLTLTGYAVAGTSAAAELGLGDDVSCARCGSRISHVFATSHGPLGGDCLATLTGDNATRAAVRKLGLALRQVGGETMRLEVSRSSSRPSDIVVRAIEAGTIREWDGACLDGRSTVVAVLTSKALDCARGLVAHFAEEHGLTYADKTTG